MALWGIIVRYMRSYRPPIATRQHQMGHPLVKIDKKITKQMKARKDEKIEKRKRRRKKDHRDHQNYPDHQNCQEDY